MKPFIIALTLYLFVNISSCSTNDAPIVEPPNGETAEDSNTPTMNEQIRIIIGNASLRPLWRITPQRERSGIVAHNCKHDRTSR